jgi:integrase
MDRTKYLYQKILKDKIYLFFRFKGTLTPLPVNQKSIEFRNAYDECLLAAAKSSTCDAAPPVQSEQAESVRIGRFAPNTVAAAIDKFIASTSFLNCSASTQRQYRRTLEQLGRRLGAGRLSDIDTDAVDIHTEQVAKKSGTSVADRHLRVLSLIWKTCRKYPEFEIKGKYNPTIDAEKRHTTKQKHRPWPREVQERFMETAPDHLKLAKLLLHFSAQRGGDCIRMKWEDFDGNGLWVRPEKTHGEVAAEPNYHMCPKPLRDALMAAPRPAETILVNANGTPYGSASTLSHAIRRELIKLGFVKPGQRSYVMHGLRKTAASDIGSLGVGAAGIKTITGHRTDAEANEYAAYADKRRVNAMVVEQWNAELERQAAKAVVEARRAEIKRVK